MGAREKSSEEKDSCILHTLSIKSCQRPYLIKITVLSLHNASSTASCSCKNEISHQISSLFQEDKVVQFIRLKLEYFYRPPLLRHFTSHRPMLAPDGRTMFLYSR